MNTGLKPCFFRSSTVLRVVVDQPIVFAGAEPQEVESLLFAALSSAARFCFSHASPNGVFSAGAAAASA